ncbi:hypothetical protein VTN49DRAFT_5829 [Thermomyces lanuginosus]|uniref:uncharacterized protein n=1 Tax=Thermomyces lanuginosus TaxID=5541 RepID=UPI003743896E
MQGTQRPPANWKPWQISLYLLIALIVLAPATIAVIEFLVFHSNKPVECAEFPSQWQAWYTANHSSTDHILPLDLSSVPCHNNLKSSKTGFLIFQSAGSISPSYKFLWLYFPSIFAVIYALFWQIIDGEVKRIEPIYKTSRPGGARVGPTLFSEYISWPPIFSPIQALRRCHWDVLCSSSIYVLIGFITPVLQTQMFQIQSQGFQVGYIEKFSGRFQPFTKRGSSTNITYVEGPLLGIFWDDPANFPHAFLWKDRAEGTFRNVAYLDPVRTRAQTIVLGVTVLFALHLLLLTLKR